MAYGMFTIALLLAAAAAVHCAPAALVPALRPSFPTRQAAVAAMAPFLAGAPTAGPTVAARNPTYVSYLQGRCGVARPLLCPLPHAALARTLSHIAPTLPFCPCHK